MRSLRYVQCTALCALFLGPAAGQAREDADRVTEPTPVAVAIEQIAEVTPHRFDGDVRTLTAAVWKPGDPIREIPRRFYPKPGMVGGPDPLDIDPLVQQQQEPSLSGQLEGLGETFTTPNRNFDGIGFTGVTPPDPTGAVGPNHYIQAANASGGALVRIYDKALPTPTQLAQFSMDSLGTAQCGVGLGDPIVLYDRHADRFMLSEFSASGNNLCMYVSQTADPVSGGWYAYRFTTPSFPDYPKYGTWPTDASGGDGSYIVTANDGGPGIYAMDRGAMLAGNAASFIRVTIPGLSGFGFEAPTPADLDGSLIPPSGAPAIIMRHRDTEAHSGVGAPEDLLEMWTFDVDWINTANSAFTQQPSIDVAEFDSSLCGLTSFSCFPQPGTSVQLDPLREVIMNRLQYIRHFDGTETLVGSFVVDIDGANTGGVRWFELRGGTPGWSLYQEGTYSIDSDNRFMSSPAMDQSMNIALAYNVSSAATFPSLRYTGREASDPLGTMTQPESTIFAGTASNSSNRYGDYNHMSLDPEDDCTFWFTGETNASSLWKTQIASFGFEGCGCETVPAAPLLAAANNGDNRVDLDWNDSDLASVVSYRVLRSRTPGGPYEQIAEVTDTSPGVAGGLGYTFSDFDVSGGIDYYYAVRSSDGAACNSPDSNEVLVTPTGVCTLAPVFGGVTVVNAPEFGICTLQVSWVAGSAECGGPVSYNVYRSTSPGFVAGPGNLVAGGVTDTTFSDLSQLVDGTFYYYQVRAVDLANGVEDDNSVERFNEPRGVGGGSCVSGSPCDENPFVDVNPDGPLTVCQGNVPVLTADLAGGTGPFTYQWTRDGAIIAGATLPTYQPADLGLHAYNVRVSSESCPDEVFDGLDTVIDTVNRPTFLGLTSATNSSSASSCSIDLQWNPANNVCPGPVTYNVYRDTSGPPAITLENLIAGGLTGTDYTDTAGLIDSQPYFYSAKAVDNTTLQADDNLVVLSETPGDPSGGMQDAYFEDFTDVLVINDWAITTGPGAHNCGAWAIQNDSSWIPLLSSGNYLIADNRRASAGGTDSDCLNLPSTSTTATSPAIDLVIQGLQGVTLEVNVRFEYEPGDFTGDEVGAIDVWNGVQWINLWTSATASLNQQLSFDVTAYANSAFMVRFDYQGAIADKYFSVDNVRVVTDVAAACMTEAAGPPSVPRGSLDTTRNGAGIDLTWNAATCTATDYNLLYGDLSNVSTHALQGSVCALGNGGSFTWASPPSGDLFFVVVSTDGAGAEGSWGLTRTLAERNGTTPSNECGVTLKNATNYCE